MSLLGFFTIVKFHVCPHSKGDAQSIITFFRKRLQTTILCWFEIPESLAILSCQDIGTEILILVSGVEGVSADTIHLLLSDQTMSISSGEFFRMCVWLLSCLLTPSPSTQHCSPNLDYPFWFLSALPSGHFTARSPIVFLLSHR